MIFEGSRYQGGTVVSLKDVNGDYQLGVYRVDPATPASVQSFLIDTGTRLDQVADQMYGDPTLWWVIADANPHIAWMDDIPAGTLVKIPHGPVVR